MMQPNLNQVVHWAHEAGAILRTGFRQNMQIQHKGPKDLVTEMDHRSEEYLLAQISGAYPDHAIYAEESGQVNGAHRCQWYVDPLDGTVNYAHGIPIFSVSLALAVDGELQLGVVYDPIADETYAAERGKGATLNGKSIHPTPVDQLIDALLVTGFPYTTGDPDKPDNLALFNRFVKTSQGLRRLGSAALDLCYVAEGRLDGYWEIDLRPYDVAAGALILREAGGVVTRLDGSPDVIALPSEAVAANPALHARMLEVITQGYR